MADGSSLSKVKQNCICKVRVAIGNWSAVVKCFLRIKWNPCNKDFLSPFILTHFQSFQYRVVTQLMVGQWELPTFSSCVHVTRGVIHVLRHHEWQGDGDSCPWWRLPSVYKCHTSTERRTITMIPCSPIVIVKYRPINRTLADRFHSRSMIAWNSNQLDYGKSWKL